MAHHSAGRLLQAEQLYHQILQADPKHSVALHLRAVLALQDGKFDIAVDFASKAVSIKPDFVESFIVLGNAYQGLGRCDEAITSYGRALEIAPQYAEVHNNLGNVLQEVGKLDHAVTSYVKALAISPDYSEAHNNLGATQKLLGKIDDAVASYGRALANRPDYADALNNLGVALQVQGKLDKAVASYGKALAVSPQLAEAHNNLGNALKDQGKLDAAVASYDRALVIAPGNAEAHNNLGIALKDQGKMEEAVASYGRALAIAPDYAKAHSNLGNARLAQGKLDQAVDSYRCALANAPRLAEVHMHLAGVRNFTEYNSDIKAMEDVFAGTSLSDEQRMYLAFGLGKSFEDLRQYDKAFDFYRIGNRLKRATFAYSMTTVEQNFTRSKETFTQDLFNSRQAGGLCDPTPIFILGMPRSGTSLVEQILASHPHVYGAGELNFLHRVVESRFSRVDDDGFTAMLHGAEDVDFSAAGSDYLKLINARSDGAEFITDKMPLNFHLIGMIKLMLPKAIIIHCRRDPLDTCLSIFKNYFSADGNYFAYDLVELGRYHNLYSDLMAHWRNVLPGFIYDIHYEDVVADQEGQSRALLDHCGLEWDEACLNFHQTRRPVHTASAAQVRRPIYKDSIESWKRYESQLTPLIKALD